VGNFFLLGALITEAGREEERSKEARKG